VTRKNIASFQAAELYSECGTKATSSQSGSPTSVQVFLTPGQLAQYKQNEANSKIMQKNSSMLILVWVLFKDNTRRYPVSHHVARWNLVGDNNK
jgi:hypothetical protein